MASSSSTTAVRSWRTAFLTLRDETLTSHSPHARGGASSSSSSSSIHQLLHQLIFSHSQSFISAAPQLPPHEVLSLSFSLCYCFLNLLKNHIYEFEYNDDLIRLPPTSCFCWNWWMLTPHPMISLIPLLLLRTWYVPMIFLSSFYYYLILILCSSFFFYWIYYIYFFFTDSWCLSSCFLWP